MRSYRTFTWIVVFVNLTADLLPAVGEDMALEARLTPCELIEYHGYPCETTHVTTEDGYILQLDRVPYGIHDNVSNADQENGTSIRQPVLLVPAFFTASDLYFLNFPWQSPGFLFADNGFDVWSMNTREAQPYVNLLVAYGPVANITHIEPPFRWLMPFIPILETRMPVYVGHIPTGSTYQNFLHYHQNYEAKNLLMFDYGTVENRRLYGQAKPPPYPLERIRVPIALFPAPGDTVATPADVADLVDRLGKNVVFEHVVPVLTFRHLDFATGYRANDILHNVAIELMRKYAVEGL
ncbi:lipase lipl-1-like [Dermacentor variabilis]|uniref:lipase lipl-1-like n=1 Tax=Dermacentor variabilis TaxID=34621 RepID=UPI003F5C0C46